MSEALTVTVTEAAKMIGVDRTTLWRWGREGLIHKIPGTHRLSRVEVERFMDYYQRGRTPEERRRGPNRGTT